MKITQGSQCVVTTNSQVSRHVYLNKAVHRARLTVQPYAHHHQPIAFRCWT